MSRSLIQTSNQSNQNADAGGILALGTVLRRYGCNCRLSGNAVECAGEGYYTIDACVSVSPTAEGAVTVALYRNGVQIPGAIAFDYSTAGNPVTLPIATTVRQGCCCDSPDIITVVLIEGAGVVNNVSLRVVKE